MSDLQDFYDAKSALEWQYEIGVDETISDLPINRYEIQNTPPKLKISAKSNIAHVAAMPDMLSSKETASSVAKILAQKCNNLSELRDAMGLFEMCSLKKGAKKLVFSDGLSKSRVMVIGETPSREEDIEGKPFVGTEGELVDKMFQAIGLSRDSNEPSEAIYITTAIPWRPPQSRDPNSDEIAMMLPFLKRHIELVNPDFIVLMGNIACSAVLNKVGINKFRGEWTEAFGKQILPMLHPRSLLKDPMRKRDTWNDLLSLKERLKL
ncbi:uracil-DNA glycosylase [Amylibacter sp.]|nr:uracil-DNA glycosylase [Amylibacter sp.]